MLLVNYSHPITSVQCERIAELAGQRIDRAIDMPAQLDVAKSFASASRFTTTRPVG